MAQLTTTWSLPMPEDSGSIATHRQHLSNNYLPFVEKTKKRPGIAYFKSDMSLVYIEFSFLQFGLKRKEVKQVGDPRNAWVLPGVATAKHN